MWQKRYNIFTILIITFFVIQITGCNKTEITDNSKELWKNTKEVKNLDPWILETTVPDNNYGTYLGNGTMGIRLFASGTGNQDENSNDIYISTMYKNQNIVKAPQIGHLQLFNANNESFELETKNYKQTLNMKKAYLQTTGLWQSGKSKLIMTTDFYVIRTKNEDLNACLIKINIIPKFTGEITLVSPVLYDEKQISYENDTYKVENLTYKIIQNFSETETTSNASTYIKTGKFNQSKAIKLNLEKNKPKEIYYYAEILDTAIKNVHLNKLKYNALIKEHEKTWSDIWKSDIIIEGDSLAQQVVHSNMFYLLSSASKHTSIPPMGWSANSFNGHVFWDAELWMMPALIWQHPEYAKGIIKYRIKTLHGAIENAQKNGMKGAEYAWESGTTGIESAPGNIETIKERHINGDIAFSIWQYYTATKDKEFLKECYPIIKETANYWTSKAVLNKTTNKYEITDVCPPDETAGIVNNSVFTNAIAKINLILAGKVALILGQSPNPQWIKTAENILIPLDKEKNRFIIYDNYSNVKIKQADPELLLYPLKFDSFEKTYFPNQNLTEETFINTYDFYREKVMENGPAMSYSAHTVISSRLNRLEEAFDYFEKSYKPYMRGYFNYYNEKKSPTYKNWCFLTGAGSSTAAVLWGFCGLDMDYYSKELKHTYNYNLPKTWKKVILKNVNFNGKIVDLTYENKKITEKEVKK